jgi:dihydrofolate synthase/folylpolyglutamate synthase
MMIRNILRKRATEKGCSFIDASVHADECRDYAIGMSGEHQLYNAAAAVEAVRAAGIDVSEDAVRKGLAEAVLPGRFEVIGDKPYIILDGAHNPDAAEELCRTFLSFARQNKIKRTRVIFGCMKDKNYRRMIQLLTGKLKGCSYAAVSSESSRSEEPEALREVFETAGRKCICYDSVRKAFDEAKAANFECILITGSIYLVGAARDYLSNQNCIE